MKDDFSRYSARLILNVAIITSFGFALVATNDAQARVQNFEATVSATAGYDDAIEENFATTDFYNVGDTINVSAEYNEPQILPDVLSMSSSHYIPANGGTYGTFASTGKTSARSITYADARSSATGSMQIINSEVLEQLDGTIETLRFVLPIHGDVFMYNPASGDGSPGVGGDAYWGFTFNEEGFETEDFGQLFFEDNGLQYADVFREGIMADESMISLTQRDDFVVPLYDVTNAKGYEVLGNSVFDVDVDLQLGDEFQFEYFLETSVSTRSGQEGWAFMDFSNTASFDIFALDSNGNVVGGSFFSVSSVPEPGSGIAIMLLGGLVALRRKR